MTRPQLPRTSGQDRFTAPSPGMPAKGAGGFGVSHMSSWNPNSPNEGESNDPGRGQFGQPPPGGQPPTPPYPGPQQPRPPLGQPPPGYGQQPPPGQYVQAPAYPPGQYPPPGNSSASGFFGSLFDFSFSSFVGPKLIKVLYVLITVVTGLTWLLYIIFGFASGYPILGLLALIGGGIFSVISLAFSRVTLEFFMAIFRMSEDIRMLKDRGRI